MGRSPNRVTSAPAGCAHTRRNAANALTTTVVAVMETEKLAAYCGRTGAMMPNPIAIANAASTSTQICRGICSAGGPEGGGEEEDGAGMAHPLFLPGVASVSGPMARVRALVWGASGSTQITTLQEGHMRVGIPTEVKDNEYRVAITPVGVHELVAHGHEVFVQRGAGVGSTIPDAEYEREGATLLEDPDELWAAAEMVLKVKEPVPEEYHRLRPDLVLFTYLHLAANRECTEALLGAGTTAIAYETVQAADGHLPLLFPMSEVAGCLAPQVGAVSLMKPQGGRGVLLGGVVGVASAKVVILGGGVSGQNAANIALGMGAEVTILDTNAEKLRLAWWRWRGQVKQLASSALVIRQQVADADLVIGSVLIPGARAPRLVTNEMVAGMKEGSVLVDISIDQGGCFEDSRPTTHSDPTYRVHGSTFYCVANMPGAVPNTSTYALTNATLPYAVRLASQGWREAMRADAGLALGLNAHAGEVVFPGVAEAFDLAFTPADEVLA